jgi:broad specificity phosphatase PhoE
MAVVLLVRHGQASFGAADYDALSPTGEEQARIIGRRLAALPRVDRVVHGTMRRQRDTATLLAEALPTAPRWSTDAGWDEYDHEALLRAAAPTPAEQEALGRAVAAAPDPRRAFQEQFDRALARWTGGRDDDDYPEHFGAFADRVAAAVERLVGDLDRSETAVVATSGGVIAAVAAAHLGLDARRWAALNRVIVNTSVTKLVTGRSGVTLLSLNDHAHLEALDRRLLTYR